MNRDALKAAIAVTLLVVSAVLLYRFFAHGAGDDAPKDQFVPFHCKNCGADFQYSHSEIDEIWRTRAFQQKPGKVVLFKCPKCGQFAAERAETPDDTSQTPPGPVTAPPH